ncbi:MAG: hypothetical protein MUD08_05335 [Cytophagales bacterium]|jgi:hypothetical protein|nr:hypothetical protein [Cytophagales bacterium]
MKINSLSYVNMSDLVVALGFDHEEVRNTIEEWSFGDTLFTLVGNLEFMGHLIDNFVGEDEAEQEAFIERFWATLGDGNAYVNLEA